MDKKLVGILVAMLLISIVALPEIGQGIMSGPVQSPPHGVDIVDSETLPPEDPDYGEQLGRDGGRTLTFTVFQVSEYSQLRWQPTDVGLALDGAIDAAGESLTYNSIVDGKAIWTGNTQVEVLNEATSVYESRAVNTKFILTVKNASDSLITFEFVDGAPAVNLKALSPNPSDEVEFTATLEMKVQVPSHDSITAICPYTAAAFAEGVFLPALDVFDCLQTNPVYERPAISMFEYGFFYEISLPTLDLEAHDEHMEELVGGVQTTVDNIHMWTQFLYDDWPGRIGGLNAGQMQIEDNIGVLGGTLDGVVMTVGDTNAKVDSLTGQLDQLDTVLNNVLNKLDGIDESVGELPILPDLLLLMFGLTEFMQDEDLKLLFPLVSENSPLYQGMDSIEAKLDVLTSKIDEIAAEVNKKLDIEIFQMSTKGECVYHVGASIEGLPVEIDLAEAYAVRYIKNQQMEFESLSESDYELSSFGGGHLRMCMTMSKAFPAKDAIMFQFIFVNPDTGLHATVLVPHEHEDEDD